ncbi:MAG: hypothetical protein KBF42_06840 [Chitinophagales bacterium]|jgi:hypothetical protein|nr:hypothetical protein [Bacteroidota bacterium]MBP8915967.1 hypothetical protein [Chitinophagales bacterium]MBP9221081.1 hypothetical protein [Chitinophagales bacterium]MBP9795243.1 hypothetical protein [Chitinophagales bacterium]
MLTSTQHENLINKGWHAESLSNLEKNKLNAGVKAFYSYKNTLSLRVYPEENMLRLMIHAMQDNRCLQFDCEDKAGDFLNKIIEIQDDINIENYFSHYFALQEIGSVSVVMTEQFL